jgi:DUF1680 family protein
MNLKNAFTIGAFACVSLQLSAQDKSLVNTSKSPYVNNRSINVTDVKWTGGYWGQWQKVVADTMVSNILALYCNPDRAHAYRNFEIAAGVCEGEHQGPAFHDGDFYKVIEGAVMLYGQTGDEKLHKQLDEVIATIAKAQRADGYIHTPTMIAHRNNPGQTKEFEDRLNFETYNMGHLMSAACLHYRITGSTAFLDIARKATDYLLNFYNTASPELARNAICPSHYMGVIEMYRTTGDKRYLELAKNLIDIRGMVEAGTDDNQDRVPFRQQNRAMGHAVRANYLYAGVADVYAETGDTSLLNRLFPIWEDVTQRKMYVTGGCGALYDGTSPDGTCYDPKLIQKVHQSYGRPYQLPNLTAHNETCANIGNMLWNWRMFEITGEARFADIVELTLYNSIPSGISVSGTHFCYNNPLKVDDKIPFTLRWSKEREEYIALSNCCPPNVVRTLSESSAYAYSLSANGVMVNLYGQNQLTTQLSNGENIKLSQSTNYPWDGKITITVDEAPTKACDLSLRIPGWCKGGSITINKKEKQTLQKFETYQTLNRVWKKGDVVELDLDMPAVLLTSNPLVEETRNQVCVKRGPVVYCIEQADGGDVDIFDVVLPSQIKLKPVMMDIAGMPVAALSGSAYKMEHYNRQGQLYTEMPSHKPSKTPITLIPYFAWGNRGKGNMSVWMPMR